MNSFRLIYAAAFVWILSACTNEGTREEKEERKPDVQRENLKEESSPEQETGNWEKLVMQQFRDGNGIVTYEMPLPAAWKQSGNRNKGEPGLLGPHGIRVTDYENRNFLYPIDTRLLQAYYQSGQPLRIWPGVDQLIEQDIIPQCMSQGLQFVRHYEIPEVAKTEQWFNDQLYKAVPCQTEVAAIGTEWTTADGSPYFLLVHITLSVTAELQTWGYRCTGLEVEKSYFENAKKQLLFGMANTHFIQEPILAFNRREAEKAGQSWAAFNQRMAQNQANFEASQRAHVNRTNAINDAIMTGWRERNAASDKQQEGFIDVINERTNVVDPSTGQTYKVASGNNQYWMNNSGQYIGTDRADYNPNLDENMNNEKWQELNEIKK